MMIKVTVLVQQAPFLYNATQSETEDADKKQEGHPKLMKMTSLAAAVSCSVSHLSLHSVKE
jgi:hypothetical protein